MDHVASTNPTPKGGQRAGFGAAIGLIVGIIGGIAGVAGNIEAITKSVSSLLGHVSSPAPKVTLIKPKIIRASIKNPSNDPPIDLGGHALQKEDGTVVTTVDKSIAVGGNVTSATITVGIPIEQFEKLLKERLEYLDKAIKNLKPQVIRAAVHKESDASISDCKIRLDIPNGEIQTTANSVELVKGIWTDYFEFAVATTETYETGITAILYCSNNGIPATSGPIDVEVVGTLQEAIKSDIGPKNNPASDKPRP